MSSLTSPTTPRGDDGVLWDVVEEHLDEAEFLLERWLSVARSARSSLADMRRTVEPRLHAHLDGLVVGEALVAVRLLWPALAADSEAPSLRVAAAALALLQAGDAMGRDRLLERLRLAEAAPVREGLQLAFQLTARADVDDPVRLALYATDAAPTQAALLAVLAARRFDPGPILGALLRSPDGDPAVLAAALHAAAAGEWQHHHARIEPHLAHGSAAVRAAALRTALIWNQAPGWKTCLAEAQAGAPEAMVFVALLGGAGALPLLTSVLRSVEHRGAALFALGFSGRVEAVDACLAWLDDPNPRIARLALEAVAATTGLPMDEAAFVAAAPDGGGEAGDELPPLEEDLELDLAPHPVDELPLPNPLEVRSWWADRRVAYAPDRRYLGGEPLSTDALEALFAHGPLRRTGPFAAELAIRSGGRVQLPALRLSYPRPAVPAGLSLYGAPAWR